LCSGPPSGIFTDICMPFLNATFSTPPIMIYVLRSTNYESYRYAVCLPSCLFLSCLSVLHYTTHFTSLGCWGLRSSRMWHSVVWVYWLISTCTVGSVQHK
jgi:hypothetical protein